MSIPKGGREGETANRRRCLKKVGGEFLYSGVMWPSPVTVINEEQRYCNNTAVSPRNGRKREVRKFKMCTCLSQTGRDNIPISFGTIS